MERGFDSPRLHSLNLHLGHVGDHSVVALDGTREIAEVCDRILDIHRGLCAQMRLALRHLVQSVERVCDRNAEK